MLVSMLLVLALVILLPLTAFLSIRWTNRMRDMQVKTLESQMEYLRANNQTLLNLSMSRDPMTLASLSQLTSPQTSSASDYVGTSDESEYARYAELNGIGEEIIPDDELRELEARL